MKNVQEEKSVTEKKYFGVFSYFTSLALITLVVWAAVGRWILAVIPYIVFGAFFLSLFADMMVLFATKKVSLPAIRNAMNSNFKAFAATILFFVLAYLVFSYFKGGF